MIVFMPSFLRKVPPPIVHNAFKAPKRLQRITKVRERLFIPPEMTIVTCHNYEQESLFEKSLKRLGIDIKDYVVLKKDKEETFRGPDKILLLNGYLQSGSCRTKYLLFCDARDTILRCDPKVVLDLFLEFGCDLLFQSTQHGKKGYRYMPEKKKWADSMKRGRYLNSGVYIGKVNFLKEVLGEAVSFASGSHPELEGRPELTREMHIHDQYIFRFLHPKYFPRMRIDYKNRIAMRWEI
jgi:hypothetical protein